MSSMPSSIPQANEDASTLARFAVLHLLLPLAVLALLYLWLIPGQGDTWLAQHLFNAQGGRWILRHNLITEDLLHRGGRVLSLLSWLTVAIGAGLAWRRPALARWRRPLLYLAVSVLVSVLCVTALKRNLVRDCPWDIDQFGGHRPMIEFNQPRPADWPAEHCFPAAHASTGYAWLALYFAAFAAPLWRRRALWLGLGLGLTFGFAQQLRGAHFLSHDLTSALICWMIALACLPILGRRVWSEAWPK